MLYVQFWAPDDGRKTRLKHVERLTEINKLWNVASCWLYSAKKLDVHLKWERCLKVHISQLCLLQVAYALLRNATISFTMSVCPSVYLSARNNSAPTGRIFMKFGTRRFLDNPFRKFKFYCNLTRITATLLEHICMFMIITRRILLKTGNISGECCRQIRNTHLTFKKIFPGNRVVYEIMWNEMVQPDRSHRTT